MADPINPYKGGPAPEERDGVDDRQTDLVNDLAHATIRDMMSERGRKRADYVKFVARQKAQRAMRSSSD